MEKKKSKKNILIAISLAMVLIASILILGAMYAEERQEKVQLDRELACSEMELYLRRYSSEKRAELALAEQERHDEEISLRASLQEAMIEKDREDLLVLVNSWNPVPEDFVARIVKIGRRGIDEDMFLDERAATALCNMISDCRAAGNRPVPISAFRTREYQQKLFDNKVLREIENGVWPEYAPTTAAQSVAVPGTSEHEIGLAVDIIDDLYQDLDYNQQWTGTQQWLMQHCTEYGFILRYPVDSQEKTGVIFEPWHYRYVGKEMASEYALSSAGTFEEFLSGR